MPLQNRVTPFGDILATPERGTMLGNRGILHNDRKEIIRTSQVRRWLCCVLGFKNIRRTIMKPGSYTELFFLDEATALAAGHRPCFECRRQDALRFQVYWQKAFGGRKPTADAMDRILAYDRWERGGRKKTYNAELRSLPDGIFIERGGEAWLMYQGHMLRWTAGGYAEAQAVTTGIARVLTPKSIVTVFCAGYSPAFHGSTSRLIS